MRVMMRRRNEDDNHHHRHDRPAMRVQRHASQAHAGNRLESATTTLQAPTSDPSLSWIQVYQNMTTNMNMTMDTGLVPVLFLLQLIFLLSIFPFVFSVQPSTSLFAAGTVVFVRGDRGMFQHLCLHTRACVSV
eukprot:1366074-Rhodomonas_salina.1